MDYVLTHRTEVALWLAAALLPVYFIAKWERAGFVLGVLSFWACLTAALWILPTYGEDADLAPGCFLVSGWFHGTLYCWPLYAVKRMVQRRRLGPPPQVFCCRHCGYCQRTAPVRCPDCGTFPATDRPPPGPS